MLLLFAAMRAEIFPSMTLARELAAAAEKASHIENTDRKSTNQKQNTAKTERTQDIFTCFVRFTLQAASGLP